jgi:hypothetical protein
MLLTITYLPFWKTIKSYIIHNRRLTLEPIIIEKAISLLKKYQQDVKGPAFQVLTAVMFNLERSFFTKLSTYLKLSEPELFQKLPENID